MTTPALAENVRGKGRHYRNPADGSLVPSVTNVIGMMDKPALPRWSAKMVAERAALMKHSLAKMDDGDIVDTLKAVPWQRSNRAADRGTSIHEYLEARLNDWEPEPLSDDAEPYRAAADDFMLHADIQVVETEITMFHPLYAGTADFVARIDGTLTIGDFKTSKAIYDEAALQLAALWGCYTDQHGDPVPWREGDGEMPELRVVRIGQDGWEQKTVANPQASLSAFFGLLTAWQWKHDKAWVDG